MRIHWNFSVTGPRLRWYANNLTNGCLNIWIRYLIGSRNFVVQSHSSYSSVPSFNGSEYIVRTGIIRPNHICRVTTSETYMYTEVPFLTIGTASRSKFFLVCWQQNCRLETPTLAYWRNLHTCLELHIYLVVQKTRAWRVKHSDSCRRWAHVTQLTLAGYTYTPSEDRSTILNSFTILDIPECE